MRVPTGSEPECHFLMYPRAAVGEPGAVAGAAGSWVMDETWLRIFSSDEPSCVCELKEVMEEFVSKGLDFRLLSAASHRWFM